ncbi:MAG: hypothetical protein AAGD38_20920 [Acidobacteriota bacterium]
MAKPEWKKGRGRLGALKPLHGTWQCEFDGDMGKGTCTRTFTQVLDKAYVQLNAVWAFESGKVYEEMALYGVDKASKEVRFFSFTSDGKRSEGKLVEAPDLPEGAIAFEAQMPAGLARMAYWPEDEGLIWTVESHTKKGWNRFLRHVYAPTGV